LIVGAVLVAGFLIGAPLQNAFSTAAAGMPSSTGGPARRIDERIAGATPARSQEEAASGRAIGLFWLAIVVAAGVPSIIALWLVRRRAFRAVSADASEPMPVPKELQAKFVAKRQAILQFLSADTQHLVNGHMAVRHIMSKTPLTKT